VANLVLAFAEICAGAIVLDAGIKGDSITNVIKGQATQHPLAGDTSNAPGVQDVNTPAGSSAAAGTTGAAATATAKTKLAAMQGMASMLKGKPYQTGGGHSGFLANELQQIGFDCSGFVSAVLHAGGYLSSPVDTVALPSQPGIASGPGSLVTIYDRDKPGDLGHVIIDLAGQWWESGGGGSQGAPNVHQISQPDQSYLSTFDRILHPAGM